MEITNLGQADGLPPVDWAAVAEKLAAGLAPAPDAVNSRTTWLCTINQDGSPHVTAVGALWLDGTFWFQTRAGTRKGRNVARDPRCSIAVSVRDADVVLEGDAARVCGQLPGARPGRCLPAEAPSPLGLHRKADVYRTNRTLSRVVTPPISARNTAVALP
jgi:Pyridoxamine 5'-phosphate oxidase